MQISQQLVGLKQACLRKLARKSERSYIVHKPIWNDWAIYWPWDKLSGKPKLRKHLNKWQNTATVEPQDLEVKDTEHD